MKRFLQKGPALVVAVCRFDILPAGFDSVEVLADGLIVVEDKKRGLGYTDREGRFIWGPTY